MVVMLKYRSFFSRGEGGLSYKSDRCDRITLSELKFVTCYRCVCLNLKWPLSEVFRGLFEY